ncbi:MAG: hypothetical protein M5R37_07410 [Melioribacteraceae bacterium]|nr:hypothetical protein [Melioribacteraceae bacterium]
METVSLEREFIKQLENQEAQYWSDYYICCKSPIQEKLGVSMNIINGAFCFAIAKTDRLAFNRVLGIGLEYEITDQQLKEIINFYKQVGTNRFMIQVSPAAFPENNEELLLRNGFIRYNQWAKSYKKLVNEIEIPESKLNLENLELSNIEEFENVIKLAFEFEYDSHLLISRTYKKPGWKHYLTTENGKPIAAASMFICGKFASLAIGGTIPEDRGKGAQSLLIAQRLNDAYKAGCEYVVVETSEDLPDKPSQSYRNILKAGFEHAYLRPNYVYNF